MNILITLNSNYIRPLKVMLKSLFLNNPGERFDIYLMHSSLKAEEIADIGWFIEAKNGQRLFEVKIGDEYFRNAPVVLHYSKEMYYRLLAYRFLPKQMSRILYLDPDILVINPVRELYETAMEGCLYAAAYHSILPLTGINRIRLSVHDIEAYYNSGVLLMDLELQRKEVDERAIYQFVEKDRGMLIMPDQDIMNALYAKRIKTLDEKLYNYDVRFYHYYKLSSNGLCDMDYIFNNTVFLHFCGKKKPWRKNYSGRFHCLYKHYEKLALQETEILTAVEAT